MSSTSIMPLAWKIALGAKRAGIGETKFREAIKAGEMEVLQIGDMQLVTDDEIRRWLSTKRLRAACILLLLFAWHAWPTILTALA